MKDSEFLELLNLYLDHEIGAAEAARLEAEVQANPNRRAVYHDYCRMQKACTLLAKDFADQPATDRKVIAFEPRRSAWTPGLLAVGGLAVAAACVALVLINRAPTAAPMPASVATIAAVPSVSTGRTSDTLALASAADEPATVITRTVTTVPARRTESRPMLAAVPLTLAGANASDSEALFAAQQNATTTLEWMKNVQLAPMQPIPLDELRLDARSPLQPASRTYSNGQAVQGSVEMTAFRFQR